MNHNEIGEYMPYVTHLRVEHRKISEVVNQIRALYFNGELSVSSQSDVDQGKSLVEHLGSLRALLGDHFDEEESGGCLEEAISRRPDLVRAAGKLESEHRSLLQHLDHIIDAVRKERLSAGIAAKVANDFKAFAATLHRHECDENRILAQGFNIVPGNGL